MDFGFSWMKSWRSSKLIEELALDSSASLYPLAERFSIKKSVFSTNVSCWWLCFCVAYAFTSKEAVESGIVGGMKIMKNAQSLPSPFFV